VMRGKILVGCRNTGDEKEALCRFRVSAEFLPKQQRLDRPSNFDPSDLSPVLRLGSTYQSTSCLNRVGLARLCIEALEGLKEMLNLMTIPDRDRHPTLESFHEAVSQQCFICTTI
jgi:hypothetical protein